MAIMGVNKTVSARIRIPKPKRANASDSIPFFGKFDNKAIDAKANTSATIAVLP
ncbi:hypothetical protein SCALIN_C11_0053 [Candidatus Scalindua japonica]|uniref:Uncharacterized protein n=1 Tax=Candidatus Scalindua japonica TaxID=1284222 RepID=A0A286TX31_9BACT|nr:hypothetical protein SCALIN_C11_0053 [Candidatus Scalindua japonica]